MGSMAWNQPTIDGWWIATAGELGGGPLPFEALTDLPLRVENGMFRFGSDEGRIVVNGPAAPATMDLVLTHGPNRGRVVPAILELSANAMRICCDLSGTRRPTEFKAPAGTRHFLATYHRAAVPVAVLPAASASRR